VGAGRRRQAFASAAAATFASGNLTLLGGRLTGANRGAR